MQFEPMGGFPSIIRVKDSDINKKTLESRGFSTTNIVSISNIMDSKKKDDLFMAFGTEDENGIDYAMDTMMSRPNIYDDIEYNDDKYNDTVRKYKSKSK